MTGAEVARIVVENGTAGGIETVDGRRFTAEAVVCRVRRAPLFLTDAGPRRPGASCASGCPR